MITLWPLRTASKLWLLPLLLAALPAMAAETPAEVKPEDKPLGTSADAPELPAPEIMGRYARLEIAGVFPSAAKGKNFPDAVFPETTISASSGIGFGAAFGYQFNNIWAAELAINHRYFGLTGSYLSSAPPKQAKGYYKADYRSSVNSVTVMPTVRVGWDAYKDIRLTGSLGMGIVNNVSNVRETYQPNSANWTGPYVNGSYWNHDGMSWTDFVWSVGVGGEYRLSEKFYLTLDANYVQLGEMHWSERWRDLNEGDSGVDIVLTPFRLTSIETRLGVGYRF